MRDFYFYAFLLRGRSFCFKLIGLGVRKGGPPGLGKITGLEDCSMGTCCDGIRSLRRRKKKLSQVRESGDPCTVLADYSTGNNMYVFFHFLIVRKFFNMKTLKNPVLTDFARL